MEGTMEWTVDHRTGQAYVTVATRGVFYLDDPCA